MLNQAFVSILYGTAKLFVAKMQSLRLDAFRDRNPVGLLVLMEVDYLESFLKEIGKILQTKHLFSGTYDKDHEMILMCRDMKAAITGAASPLQIAIRSKAQKLGVEKLKPGSMSVKEALKLSLNDTEDKDRYFGNVFAKELSLLEDGLIKVNSLLSQMEKSFPNLSEVEKHLDLGWEPRDLRAAFARE